MSIHIAFVGIEGSEKTSLTRLDWQRLVLIVNETEILHMKACSHEENTISFLSFVG